MVRMRCGDVEALWDEMREAIEPQREHVLAHVRHCRHCQELYKENEGLAYSLSCLPSVEPPASLMPAILAHIKSMRSPACNARTQPDGFGTMSSPLGTLHIAFRSSGITFIA